MRKWKLHELGRALNLMGPRKWPFILTCTLAALSTAVMVIMVSLMNKHAVNGAIYGDEGLIGQAIWIALAGMGLIILFSPVTSHLGMHLAKLSTASLRSQVYEHMLSLPLACFGSNNDGDLLSRLTNDLDKITGIYDGQLFSVFYDIGIGGVSLVTMLILDWRLALIVVVLGLTSTWVNTLYAPPLRRISERIQQQRSKATARFLDIVAGNKVAKLFNMQHVVVRRFSKENAGLYEGNVSLAAKEGQRDGVDSLLSGANFLCILSIGAVMAAYRLVDFGTVVAIFSIRPATDDMFVHLGRAIADLQSSLAGASRVFALLEQAAETLDNERYVCTDADAEGVEVALRNVSFSYNDGRGGLQNINLLARQGETMALVGFSGAGKTTVLRLLLGLHQPQSGRVELTIGKRSTSSLQDWRSNFSYVSQDAFLFDLSIRENIRLGKPDATDEEVVRAARLAGAHGFVSELPDGYDTPVGENAVRLSGGQRQRIAIARAFLQDAPVLLLDEATSALDSQSEEQIQSSLALLKQGKVTIVIAHRLSTIQNADAICVLDEGRVVEQGTHEALLRQGGHYQRLYELQFTGE